MAGLGVVGADVSSLVISGDDLFGNGAVEEHQGRVGVLGHVDNGLSGVVGAGVNDVDNQDGSALGNGGLDLLGLGGLAAVGIIVLILDTGVGQSSVQSGANAGQVGITKGVPEHSDFAVLFAGRAGAAAGSQAQGHGQNQDQCDELFHYSSS